MPPQAVSDISRLFATPFVDPKTGLITQSWREYVRYHLHTKVFGSIDLQGIVKPGGADFARPYTNKQLDNIPDGTTYARPRSGLLFNGTLPLAFGKNLCPNAGFESNLIGVPLNTNVAVGAAICDSWLFETDGGAGQFSAQLSNTKSRSGNNSALIILNPSITFAPNQSVAGNIFSTAQLPLEIGEIVRLSGWYTFDSVGLPSWLTVKAVIGLACFNQAGAFLQTILAAVATGITGTFAFIQAAIAIPSLINGNVPAFALPFVQMIATNTSGATQTTTPSLALIRFDDIRTIVQNTAFDLTPISTSYTFAANPCTAVTGGGVNQATVNVASTTPQFGDGLISYTGQSPAVSNLNDNTSYFIYADDPTYSGGAVAYQATTSALIANAGNGRIVFGRVTTPVHGAGNIIGFGGGNGPVTIARISTQ